MSDSGCSNLRAALAAHVPADALEARSRARVARLLDWLRDPFDEHADPTHVTGSAIVRDAAGRVLLHRHRRLGLWLQPGGHLEPGEAPFDAAVRETREETGAEARHPPSGPLLVHVDVHEGPRGHVHLDVRYLLTADADADLHPAPGESPAVAWREPSAVLASGDVSLVAAVRASDRYLDPI